MNDQIFVTMNDSFMSGWGRAAQKNKLIFICKDHAEAEAVFDNAQNRSEMKYVGMSSTPPKHYRKTMGKDYHVNGDMVQVKTIEDYPNWYVAGYFS